jgi:hypothetical protein
MNEKDNPYKHSKLRGVCVALCNGCISEEARKHGIAEGIRMAAEMIRNTDFPGDKAIERFRQFILAKAKEIEEGNG